MLSSVDFPHPLGPIMATISFWATVRLMSRTASTISSCFRKVFETCRRSIMAACLEDRSLMAAVDVDIGACNERGAFRGQKCDRLGDVLRRSPTAERHFCAPLALLLLETASILDLVVQRESFGEGARDSAWAHGVDKDAVRRQLVGERFYECVLGGVDHS